MIDTFTTSVCLCNPLADEHCFACRNRHKLDGQAVMPYTKTTPLLAVENVSLSFGSRPILRDVNVRIRKIIRGGTPTGRIVAFLGPSGIGKSQFLRILAGLQEPTSGNVFLDEDRMPVHPGLVGLVSQNYYVYPNRSILGNLKIAAMQKSGTTTKDATDKAMGMLQMLSTDEKRSELVRVADSYPSQLSGGQRQRVAIGQQLLCSEHYLLMDEPTSGLDPKSKREVCQIITNVANSGDGITVIMVTHDIATAASIADTIWLMGREHDEQGNIIPGARIVDSYDLIECGLTWNPNSKKHPAFSPLVREIEDVFEVL